MATGFVGSRSILKILSKRTDKRTGKTSVEARSYLSSQESGERTPEGWIDLSRSHWAGVENRNHYRRDATLGEDRTRNRHPRTLMNLALLRSVTLRLHASEASDTSLPARREQLAAHPAAAFTLLRTKL